MKHLLSTVALAIIPACLSAQTAHVEKDYAARLHDMKEARIDTTCFNTLTTPEGRQAVHFLYAYMPWPDLADYSPEYYVSQIKEALKARNEMPWGKRVPMREWLHFVLPVRINNESPDTFRTTCYAELKKRVQGLSMLDAALEVNHWCHEYVTYKPSDARTSSPLASMRTATGRCGEESTFTVAALRAVGIPARQVYTPRWAHTDDNHAWVEAWVDGKWHFLGACEPEPVLDLGWFNRSASRGMLMHTKVFGRYDGKEDVMSRTPWYTEINVTENYAPVSRQTIEVQDEQGRPVSDATVDFKLYNYAELYTVMRTQSDTRGQAAITAGIGNLVAWASKGDRYGFAVFVPGKENKVVVTLNHKPGDRFDLDLDLTPPAESTDEVEVSPKARAKNDLRMAYEDSIRNAYIQTFPDSVRTAAFCQAQGLPYNRVRPWVVKSRGNWENLFHFLSRKTTEERELAFDILKTLSEKDLRDFDLKVLEDHYAVLHSQLRQKSIGSVEDLGPRVANEKLTTWRSYFTRTLSPKARKRYLNNPDLLARHIAKDIRTDEEGNPQHYCLSPETAYRTKRADGLSKGILFVAAARSIGIPSRIDEVTGKVQYRMPEDKGKEWHTVSLVEEKKTAHTAGTPLLIGYTPRPFMENPVYYTHFTLSRIDHGRPVLQEYGEGDTWRDGFSKGVTVDAADYLLTSGTRMADGSVAARLSVFPVSGNTPINTSLIMRKNEDKLQVIGSFNAENLVRFEGEDADRSLLSATGRGYYVAALIRANHEPSNHILHDLERLREQLEAWGRPIVLLFPSEDELKRFESRREEFAHLPSTVIFGVDRQGAASADMFDGVLAKGKELPVAILADTFNRVVFLSQGYTIGIGEQIKQALEKL